MASGDLPEEKQKYVTALQEACDGLWKSANGGTDDGWQDVGTNKGIKVMKKPGGAINVVKGTGVIKAPAELILEWAENIEKCKKWDDTVDKGRIVEEVAANARVEHWTYKGSWPTSPRDFCVVVGRQERDGGAWIIGERSVVHPGAPEVKGNVRGEIIDSGFVLRPVKDEENAFEVTYVTQTDPKGNIPKALMNSLSENGPLSLARMRDLVEKAHAGK